VTTGNPPLLDARRLSLSLGYPNDLTLLELVRSAKHSLSFAGPGMSLTMAKLILELAEQHPAMTIEIMIDLNAEVCRLGFGSLEAVQILRAFSELRPDALKSQRGLRLCVLSVDSQTLVYPASPQLVEAPPDALASQPIALAIAESESSSLLEHIQQGPNSSEVEPYDFYELKEDLEDNPPLPFDLSRKVHVFNAQFEFVEFELKGLALSRKKVPLPPFLMGLTRDPQTQNLLQSSFRLIGDGTELSSDVVLKLKKRIIDRHLIGLPNYGNVILRTNKPNFERSVRLLKHYILRYQRIVETLLEHEMAKNQETVARILFPLIRQNVPSDWRKYSSGPLSDIELRKLLSEELANAFGQPEDHFQKMSCSVIFKGITYELLNDPKFLAIARKHIRGNVRLHDEYDAAKVRSQ